MRNAFTRFSIRRIGRWQGILALALLPVWQLIQAPPVFAQQAALGLRYCSFQCAHSSGGQYTPITPANSNGCTSDADCVTMCPTACATLSRHPGDGPAPTGNGVFQAGDTCASSPAPVCAASQGGGVTINGAPGASAGYGFNDPLGNRSLPSIVQGLVHFMVGISGALFLLYFIYGGFLWMTARGEADQIKKSQTALRNAIFGMAVIAFSYAMIDLILNTASTVGRGGG